MKGLGDTIENFTKATGIDKIVDKVTGGGCGCAKRKEKLNKIFPYSHKPKNNKIIYHGVPKTPGIPSATSHI